MTYNFEFIFKVLQTKIEENLGFIQFTVKNRKYRHKISPREVEITLLFPYLEEVRRTKTRTKKRKKRKKRRGGKQNCTYPKKIYF